MLVMIQAIKNLQEHIAPIIEQHTMPIIDDMNDDLESLKESYSKRIKEINDDIKNHKSKLHEWDNKINRAKNIPLEIITKNKKQRLKKELQK